MIKPAGSLCIFLINTDCKEIYHGKTVTHKKRSVVSIYFTCTICTMRVRFFVFRCIKTKKQHWHLNAHIMKVCTPWVTAFKAAVMLDSEPFMTKNARAVGANQQFYNINKCMKHLNWPLPCSLLCELQVVLWWSGHYISEYQKNKQLYIITWTTRCEELHIFYLSEMSRSAICCEECYVFVLVHIMLSTNNF